MSLSEINEADLLENVLPRYEAEGFDVFMHPSPSVLPPFMQSYRPDAVALSRDKNIAFEVVRSTSDESKKIQSLRSLFADRKDWELLVLYVSPRVSESALKAASREVIEDSIGRVSELTSAGHQIPALVMAWATLEAIGRALLPGQFRRPQTPGRLVEVLASEGYLSQAEAANLRTAISLRNAAVHGGLETSVDKLSLEQFVVILRKLSKALAR
jgi:uncharacterized protein YutE (UPF0331/DUF86 family)